MSFSVKATTRSDRRTKNLVKRLQRGEIAIIDHRDLDAVAAESLVACAPAAVVNADQSISGRYPNRGPAILLRAGIPLLDEVGTEVIAAVREGEEAELDLEAGRLRVGGREYRGTIMKPALIAERTETARANLKQELRRFVENTMNYVGREDHVLLDPIPLPPLRAQFHGRHALVVVRGERFREDLAVVRAYIEETRPVLIAVDGGADALLELGLRPQIIVGDMDSVSDAALRSGAELLVHAYRDGRAPGGERLQRLGLPYQVVSATGTSEDVAMLLADQQGAELIVAVGTHSTLEDFLDKGRSGMASTWLTRLRLGAKLVDARGVSHLYQRRLRWYHLVTPLAFGVLITLAGFAFSSGFKGIINDFLMQLALRRH